MAAPSSSWGVLADDEEPSMASLMEQPAKKSRANVPWTLAEEQRLKTIRDAGTSWAETAKAFPSRTESSIKKHWNKDMAYAEFAEEESVALLDAIKEYENNKWKEIGKKIGKPAKACEQYAKEHFGDGLGSIGRQVTTGAKFPIIHSAIPTESAKGSKSTEESAPVRKETDENIDNSASSRIAVVSGSTKEPVLAADKLERISALIHSGRTDTVHKSYPDEEEPPSGPDLFVQNPDAYFGTLKILQQQVFDFGQEALGTVQNSDDGPVLLLPSSTLAVKNGSLDQDCDQMRLLFTRYRNLALGINQGLDLAEQKNFSEKLFNIVVVDSRRPRVLRVVNVPRLCVNILLKLLTEVLSYFEPGTDFSAMEKALVDIQLATDRILAHLGLPVAVGERVLRQPFKETYLEECRRICDQVFPTLAVMFLGLVSFITSHMDIENRLVQAEISPRLVIQTIDYGIVLSQKPLLCLNRFLKRPVWSFSILANDNSDSETQSEGFYLSTSLEDFTTLWGPVRLDSSRSMVLTRGGFIRRSPSLSSRPFLQLYGSEQLCHWYDWMDGDNDKEDKNKLPAFSAQEDLLIGTYTVTVIETLANQSGKCTCDQRRSYLHHFPAFELKTKIPSWKLGEKSAQIAAGQYVSLVYGHTWKLSAGWTLKDVILEDWEEAICSKPWHNPKPFYLDYLLILEISQCTGHARRISMWAFLKTQAVLTYLEMVLERHIFRDFSILVEYFSASTSFATVWDSVATEARNIFKMVVESLLSILKSTGVGEDNMLQAWDITRRYRLDGRRVKPHWYPIVKDDLACATFAVITDICIAERETERNEPISRNDSRFRGTSISSTTLHTTLCISGAAKTMGFCTEKPSSDANDMFDKWRVPNAAPRPVTPTSPKGVEAKLQIVMARHSARTGEYEVMDGKEGAHLRTLQNESPSFQTQAPPESSKIIHSNRITQRKGKKRKLTPPPTSTANFFVSTLDFKNGQGDIVGELIVEPSDTARVCSDSFNTSPLNLRWSPCKPGILSKIHKKEKETDKRIMEWAQKKGNSILPWMINHIARLEEPTAYAVEHIRGGEAEASQQVVEVSIR
ncbi:hypothetical protein V8E51_003841 [Hyaloscypha variabilis]